jgi:hypothetical protein
MSTVANPFNVRPTEALLGEIVTWDTKAETQLSLVRESLTNAGLDADQYAKDLRNRSAFARAKQHLKENRSIEKVVEDHKAHTVTFQLDQKKIVEGWGGTKRLHHDYECQVVLDTRTGDITCPESRVIEQQARELFAHAMNVRTASDITTMVQRMFRDNADLFPINPSKGVAYFVPEAHRDFTARVEQFLESVGGSLSRFPVPKGTAEGNKSVRDAVESGLTAIIDELDEMVDNWDETTRKSTQTKVVEKYKLLRHKAEVYAEYLQHTAAGVHQRLDSSKGKLMDKLSQLAEARAAEEETVAA